MKVISSECTIQITEWFVFNKNKITQNEINVTIHSTAKLQFLSDYNKLQAFPPSHASRYQVVT